MVSIKEGLTFDDVLLVPQFSDLESRSEADISVSIKNKKYSHPIIPANMKTVTGLEMAATIASDNGLAILHRFMPIDEQFDTVRALLLYHSADNIAVSVGVKFEDQQNIKRFVELGIKIICIDIAHGDSAQCLGMISWIKNNFPDVTVIAGNVATGSGAARLWLAGADIVKVGVGPGSLCTTRVETGNGYPQLSALMDVHEMKLRLTTPSRDGYGWESAPMITRPIYIIADGGIKNAGDIVKALCFSDMVMVGNLFAGTEETPGRVINIDGRQYKEYAGSSTHKTNHVEGVSAIVEYKGEMRLVLNKLVEGLRSGLSYQGCRNLEELRECPEFVKMSGAGLRESHPHDVIVRS